MYYLKLVFINISRSLRYTIPLFLIFALTTGIVVLTDNARKAGNILKKQITQSYITTVEVVYLPPFLLSGKTDMSDMQSLAWADVGIPASFSHVETSSFISFYDVSSPFLWEVNFDKTLLEGEDIVIDDQSMLGYLHIQGIQNSQFCNPLELIKGRHVTDAENGEYCALITSALADLHNLDIGDEIFFPLEQADDLITKKYEIIGIVSDSQYLMYIPHSTITGKYNNPDITLNNVKFILNSPDLAVEFIEAAIPYFEDKDYALQADDYEYKRELYPVEMMINLNSTLYIACMITGTLLLSVIMIKSAYTRVKDITVMCFLACKKKYIFLVFYLEKFIIMLAGIMAGLIAGVFLSDIYYNINAINTIYENIIFEINMNVIFFIIIIVLICTLLLLVIFVSAVRKNPMEAITHE